MDPRTLRLAAALVACLVLFLSATAAASPAVSSPSRPGTPIEELLNRAANHPISVIVGLRLETDWVPEGFLDAAAIARQRAAIDAAVDDFSARYANLGIRIFTPLPFVALTADVALLQRLDLDDAVTSLESDDSGTVGLQQSAPLIQAPAAWAAGFTGNGQTIAIIDSGIDQGHPFLQGKVLTDEACYSQPDIEWPGTSSLCPNGGAVMEEEGAGVNCNAVIAGCEHGTHVAGIAAGTSDTSSIWGIAKAANLISIQVFHRNPNASACSPLPAPCARYLFTDVGSALNRVAALSGTYDIAAVNMSLQSSFFFAGRSSCATFRPFLATAVNNVTSFGIAVVGITGNHGRKSDLSFPGCLPGIVAVGASTKNDAVAGFSNSTSEIDLLAPGDGASNLSGIVSSVPGGGFAAFWGTSMAAPHVAGALAVLRHKSPRASQATLLQDLVTTGQMLTDTNAVQKPRIKISAALNADHTAPTTPTALSAVATTATSVALSWSASSDEHGILRYSIRRRTASSETFAEIGVSPVPAYTDTAVTAATTYQYRVVALDTSSNPSAPSTSDLATTLVYADDPVVPQSSVIRGAHISDLRAATNSIRAFAGLPAPPWTDPSLAGVPAKAIHVLELRKKLEEALTAIGITPPPYTDPTLSPNATIIKAIHIAELRGSTK